MPAWQQPKPSGPNLQAGRQAGTATAPVPPTHRCEAHVQALGLARLCLHHLLDGAGINGAQLLPGGLVLLRGDLRQQQDRGRQQGAERWWVGGQREGVWQGAGRATGGRAGRRAAVAAAAVAAAAAHLRLGAHVLALVLIKPLGQAHVVAAAGKGAGAAGKVSQADGAETNLSGRGMVGCNKCVLLIVQDCMGCRGGRVRASDTVLEVIFMPLGFDARRSTTCLLI